MRSVIFLGVAAMIESRVNDPTWGGVNFHNVGVDRGRLAILVSKEYALAVSRSGVVGHDRLWKDGIDSRNNEVWNAAMLYQIPFLEHALQLLALELKPAPVADMIKDVLDRAKLRF